METNISNTAVGTSTIQDYSVSSKVIDEAQSDEFYWYNSNFSKYLGYYKQIPELKKAVDALACWTAGKGWTADNHTTNNLNIISGWGEDSFDSIMQNMIIVKKINGDAYSEIIKQKSTIFNLKPLNPSNVRHVVDKKGIIKRYDVWNGSKWEEFKPQDIFHISNDRVASEIHGTSVIEACQWIIDAKNEAMADWRRISHRSTIRVMYIDVDDTSKLSTIKTQYADAIKKGELLIIPGKRSDAELADLSAPPVANFLEWIRYLENFFYQALGIPKVILGGADLFTEASSKVGYLTFEQVYAAEQRLLEQDIKNQLGWEVAFERPVSLKEDVLGSEEKNTGQVGFQPKDTAVGMGRE